MESRLVNLKNDFNNLINIRNNVKNIFEILQSRIDKLKLLYSEFIQSNKNQMFVFGLDSFHFQSKLIDIEYDDMKRLFMAIGNRMYCEYFKLNKIIIEYILNNVNDKKIIEIVKINNYPIYKDLEPFKEYKFETLMDIHENILKMITIIVSELNNKENELTIHKSKQHIGLNIDNFVTTFNFNNNVMRERISMFIMYIEFFHKLHTKYLKRFSNKIQLIYTDINNDIKFDESLEINSNSSNSSNSSNGSNNIKIINQYNIDSDNESSKSSKSNKSDKVLSRKNSSAELSDSSISSKSDNNIINNTNNENNKLIYENMLNIKIISNNNLHKLNENDGIDLDKSVSDEEMNELFLNIETSCDSIINKNKVNNEDDVINTPLSQESYNNIEFKIDEKITEDIQNEEIKNEDIQNEEIKNEDIQNEEIKNEDIQIEEKKEYNNEINYEPNISEINESNNITDLEPDTKKKRTYKPRKKKV